MEHHASAGLSWMTVQYQAFGASYLQKAHDIRVEVVVPGLHVDQTNVDRVLPEALDAQIDAVADV